MTLACAGCTACCRERVVLTVADDPTLYRTETIDLKGSSRVVLEHVNDTCIYLGPTGCTIYASRPYVCRTYDCRVQFILTRRNARKQTANQAVWKSARARLDSLTPEDLLEARSYRDHTPRPLTPKPKG